MSHETVIAGRAWAIRLRNDARTLLRAAAAIEEAELLILASSGTERAYEEQRLATAIARIAARYTF
jgi:hypothetical protein